jgi:preprotein translocase SecE subunit
MATLIKDMDGQEPTRPDDELSDSSDSEPAGSSPNLPVKKGKAPPNYPARRPVSNSGPIVVSGSSDGGFFHIQKKGQGYWTRMGTAGGAILVGALTIQFIWSERQTFRMTDSVAEIACAIFALAYGMLAFYLMNKPRNVDFLIATDSEMKKVNWTSRKELMGSTKVVILFMFILAGFLFVADLVFGYLFYLIGVLKTPPI